VNCREAERLIDTFFDGELDGRSMRDAALHITRCKRCEAELNDRERLQELLAKAIDEEIADVDLSRIWAAVEPAIDRMPRVRWANGVGLRLAATSARVRGLVLGRRDDARDYDDAPELRSPSWAADQGGGRVWRWSLAGGTALAASVLLALALLPGSREGEQGAPRLATVNPPASAVARSSTAPQPNALANDLPFALASSRDVRASRSSGKQVQVESVNFPRSSVAMWSEPSSDTTVIWIEDEELAAGAR